MFLSWQFFYQMFILVISQINLKIHASKLQVLVQYLRPDMSLFIGLVHSLFTFTQDAVRQSGQTKQIWSSIAFSYSYFEYKRLVEGGYWDQGFVKVHWGPNLLSSSLLSSLRYSVINNKGKRKETSPQISMVETHKYVAIFLHTT